MPVANFLDSYAHKQLLNMSSYQPAIFKNNCSENAELNACHVLIPSNTSKCVSDIGIRPISM